MAEQRYASAAEVESQAEQWSEEFLECRLYGHKWQPYRANHYTKLRYYYAVQICPRCETERHTELNERGHILASWMKYPEGYLAKIGRIVGDGRDAMRLVALTRVYDVAKIRKVERPHSLAARRELGID